MDTASRLDALSKAASGLSQADFEALSLAFSPQEQRLYAYLREHGEANTIEIRQNCAIGNVSHVAISASRKLAGSGFSIHCDVRPLTNRFGNRTHLGYWTIQGVNES